MSETQVLQRDCNINREKVKDRKLSVVTDCQKIPWQHTRVVSNRPVTELHLWPSHLHAKVNDTICAEGDKSI